MKKIIIALVLIVAKTSTAQLSINTNLINLKIDSCEIVQPSVKQSSLTPIFYTYSKRKIYLNNKPINSVLFLESCRGINDSLIQIEIERYDALTENKKRLLISSLTCVVGAFGFSVASLSSTSNGNNSTTSYLFGVCAVSAGIASIATLISTTEPHQKRKEILFRDLPIVYNRYVEIYNSKLINQ